MNTGISSRSGDEKRSRKASSSMEHGERKLLLPLYEPRSTVR